MKVSRPDLDCGFDIIGDVHGCCHTLQALLERMGYRQRGQAYVHASRKAVFVGDIIDRGPRIRESLHLVRHMVEAGSAEIVLGNHELNALLQRQLYRHSGSPEVHDIWAAILSTTHQQFAGHASEWQAFLDWFEQWPLFLDHRSFRVVHACWDQRLIDQHLQRFGHNRVTPYFTASNPQQTQAATILHRLTRGRQLPLPEGVTIAGRDGYTRRRFRTHFWAQQPKTYADVVFQPDPLPHQVLARTLSARECRSLGRYSGFIAPVFVGHYWLSGRPYLQSNNVCCVDYSAVRGGRLMAYRLDHEQQLQSHKFVWVDYCD